jgi:transketolase
MFAYGPVMLHEALTAGDLLQEEGFSLKIVNLPWLNRIDQNWLEQTVGDCQEIFVVDNHSPYGGLGDSLLNAVMQSDRLRGTRLTKFAIDDYPVCGTPPEVLHHHRLDGESMAARIRNIGKG